MNVVRHKHISVYRHIEFRRSLAQGGKIGSKILVLAKGRSPVNAPLNDMNGLIWWN